MSAGREEYLRRVLAGQERGPGAVALRALTAAVSPFYATAMRLRNLKYDRGWGVQRLPRPVISVGNLTTGGTGKTPVVRWLCERLREAGERPAVLLRGYKAARAGAGGDVPPGGPRGDEQRMLADLLARPGAPEVPVQADPDRHAGGLAVLARRPDVSVFVLDDAFQHRRLARDFDLVLVDASNPFGYGRVLPRGLLREPLGGLRRADAVLITRSDQAPADALAEVERVVGKYQPSAPVYRCAHEHTGLRSADGQGHALAALSPRRFYAFAGIGNPEGFLAQLRRLPGALAGFRAMGDHWNYSPGDVAALAEAARTAGADLLLTTAKDWVKVAPLLAGGAAAGVPVWRIELAVRFAGDAEARLLRQVTDRLQSRQ